MSDHVVSTKFPIWISGQIVGLLNMYRSILDQADVMAFSTNELN